MSLHRLLFLCSGSCTVLGALHAGELINQMLLHLQALASAVGRLQHGRLCRAFQEWAAQADAIQGARDRVQQLWMVLAGNTKVASYLACPIKRPQIQPVIHANICQSDFVMPACCKLQAEAWGTWTAHVAKRRGKLTRMYRALAFWAPRAQRRVLDVWREQARAANAREPLIAAIRTRIMRKKSVRAL